MKKMLLCIVTIVLAWPVFISGIEASALNSSEQPSLLEECNAYVPDVPDLPEDDILYGDVNNDGMVNILDVITVVNYIMGGNPDPFNLDAADVNNDGIINILDVVFDINVILETPGIPCAGFPTVLCDGQTYNTVKIGNQCWFKENLNVGTMIISNAGGQLQTDNSIVEKYCFDNNAANCLLYGGLYEWKEAMQYVTSEGSQGICPEGWHIPSDGELKVLEGTVDAQYPVGDPEWDGPDARGYNAGGNLKESGTVHWSEPNTGATNSSGFTALPAGHREYNDGNFLYVSEFGYYWSSSQMNTEEAWERYMSNGSAEVYRVGVGKQNGFSVRCLKNTCEPAQADAGENSAICAGQTFTLANAIASDFSGLNWMTSGTGLFDDPTLLHPIYTPSTEDAAMSQVTLTLTAYGNGSCGPVSDAMILTILPSPSVANAGPDQLNIDGTSTSLAGNIPVTGTGLWEIVNGTGGIIGAPANPASGFQGIAGNSYTLSWTIASSCGTTADQVVISFGENFSCGEVLLYEGQSYSTILIGTQCWMSENLNIGTMISSTSGGQLQTDDGVIQKYCYQNTASNCDTYGGLYEWNEAMQYVTAEGAQGICPAGWHVPTHAEMMILEGTVDSQYPVGDPIWNEMGYRGFDAGGNLKETGTIHWLTPNTGATNSSGFTGLPGGQRHAINGAFANLTGQGNFWTSSQYDANSAYCRSLRYLNADIRLAVSFKNDGYSVRCLKD